jgi:hypothetical protein
VPVFLYESEAWSLILRDEHKSEVSENNVHINYLDLTRVIFRNHFRILDDEKLPDLNGSHRAVRVVKFMSNDWLATLRGQRDG